MNLADVAVVASIAVVVFAVCATSCGVQPKTVANVLKPTAEQCVEISRQNNNKELETICATIEDLAPFLPVIFAYQQKRLGQAASASASSPPPPAPPAPASSSPAPVPSASAVPACSCK